MKTTFFLILLCHASDTIAQQQKISLKVDYIEKVKNRVDSASLDLKYNSYKAYQEKKTELYIINDSSFYTYNEYKTKKKLFSKILDSNSVEPELAAQQNILTGELNKMKAIKDFSSIYAKKIGRNIVAMNDFTYDNVNYRKYFIIDTLEKINWQLIDENKYIDSFKCQKAIGSFRGRSWEVWFTHQLPLSAGPWKLHGLPGLILEGKDTSNLYSFTCTSIQAPIRTLNKEDIGLNNTVTKISTAEWNNILSARNMAFKESISKIVSVIEKGTLNDTGPEARKTVERFKMLNVESSLPYSPIELHKE